MGAGVEIANRMMTGMFKRIFLLTCCCYEQGKETQESVHLLTVFSYLYQTIKYVFFQLKCSASALCQRCLITANEFPQLPDFLTPLSLLTFGRPPFLSTKIERYERAAHFTTTNRFLFSLSTQLY